MSRSGSQHFTVFETRMGPCAIGWQDQAITRIALPGATTAETTAKLISTGARPAGRQTPPGFVRDAVKRVRRHLGGTPQDFRDLPLFTADLPVAWQRIYAAARELAPGETVTYGALAARAGLPRAARAAGTAMAQNPLPIAIPCHRVLGAGGSIGGFSAPGGLFTKRRLLDLEGVRVSIPRTPVPRRRPDGLEFDWKVALAHLRKADPKLGQLIARVGRRQIEIRTMHDPFESLMRAIVYQQLSGKAAGTILGRVLALYPGGKFPAPAALLETPVPSLRAAGLSANKTKALQDLARKAMEGVVPPLRTLHRLRDDEIIERLTSVWGVGQWSVEMMLMFRLGRADVLPIDDLGVRKGFALTYGYDKAVPAPIADLVAQAESWRPYRTVASWYMWRAVELASARG